MDYEQLSDYELIRNIKTKDCPESIKTLNYRHLGLCRQISKKYAYRAFGISGVFEDIIAENSMYLTYQAAKEFDFDKNVKFCTYFGNKVRFYCYNEIADNNKHKKQTSSMEEESFDCYFNNLSQKCTRQKEQLEEHRDSIFNILSKYKDIRAIEIFKLRYYPQSLKDKTWKKIGEKMGMSGQCALNIHNEALKFLNQEIKNKNIYAYA